MRSMASARSRRSFGEGGLTADHSAERAHFPLVAAKLRSRYSRHRYGIWLIRGSPIECASDIQNPVVLLK
jgi:hypothetical protein